MVVARTAGMMAALVLLAASTTAAVAAPPDLTGEWKGTVLCDGLTGGKFGSFEEHTTISIAQTGWQFTALYKGTGDAPDDLVYRGYVQRGDHGQVEAAAIACGGDYAAGEVIRLRPVVLTSRKGYFDGMSNFFTRHAPGYRGISDMETCKYSFERVSTVRPKVPACSR
ncbi:hypothetical protein [Geminicoccus harenae]|uniref:hypothetical protein n=1 Tax=Geminicoccus harenae TaxID=2498453 RepID=UPI00168B062F|nr:hypothetical protein [Geminicoccus harenae]